jgi:hypothetical protein
MKIKLVFGLVSLFFLSCSTSEDGVQTELLGRWDWRSTSGGLAGTLTTPESTGTSRSLEFTETILRVYEDGVLISEGSYQIETRLSTLFDEPREMLVQDGGFQQIIEVSSSQLLLIGDCNDCFSSEYRKE